MGDAEAAATALREAWNLGTDPLREVPVVVTRTGVSGNCQRFSFADELGPIADLESDLQPVA